MSSKQTRLRTDAIERNRNKSLPIGTIIAVKEYLGKLGFEEFFNGLKEKGTPLFPLVCALISYRLTENFSIEGCGRWLLSKEVRREIGIDGNVSGRMLNRAVERAGENMERAVVHMRDSLFSVYDLEHTDMNADTSSVPVYSEQTDLFRFGHSRDHRPDLRQVSFGVSELRDPINIPLDLIVKKGNTSDTEMFLGLVDNIDSDIGDGSIFVLDAGADSKDVLDTIVKNGKGYIVKKELNGSDDVNISKYDEISCEVNGIDGMRCFKKDFKTSERHTYLYFSEDLHEAKMNRLDRRAWRCVNDANETLIRKKDGTLSISKTVSKRIRNPLIEMKVNLQTKLLGTDEESYEYARKELSKGREGFFKLECSKNLTAEEVLGMYRRRDSVEKLIESMKNQIDLKPLRVWSENTVKGTIFLAFLAQVIVSMIRYDVPELKRRTTRSIIRSLENLTVTYVYDARNVMRRIHSNFEPINSLILRNMISDTGVPGG